jgi:hypothetical protein
MTEQHIGQILKDVVGTSSHCVDPDPHHSQLTLDEVASLLSADPLEGDEHICLTIDGQTKDIARSRWATSGV